MLRNLLVFAAVAALSASAVTAQQGLLVGPPQEQLREDADGNQRSAPRGRTERTRVAFGSCSRASKEQPIWQRVLAESPDLWIWAGDIVYGDTEDMGELQRKYGMLAEKPGYRELIQKVPVLATWDDHDYGVNDGGADYPKRAESQQVFLDVFGVSDQSPRRSREGVYHAATFGPEGKRLQVILLDTRYHRTALSRYVDRRGRAGAYRPNRDPKGTMLGEAQWAWLERQLQEEADLRLIVSSIQFVAEDHIYEKWGNLPAERERMLALLDRTEPGPVVFLSGDRHHAELSRLHREGHAPVYDLTASGLNMSNRQKSWQPPEANAHRLGGTVRGYHFGLLDVDWQTRNLTMEIVLEDGSRPIQERVSFRELAGDVGGLGFADNPNPEPSGLVVDGDFDDSNGQLVGLTDKHLIFRFDVGFARTIGSADWVTDIGIDVDSDPATGLQNMPMDGTELQVAFAESSRKGEDRRFYQPRVTVAGQDGKRRYLPLADLQIDIQPSFASRRFELRLDRAKVETLTGKKLGGPFRAIVMTRGESQNPVTLMGNQAVMDQDMDATSAAPASRDLPAKPQGAIRVMSWNVLWSQPQENPEPFQRIFRAVKPDVILIQEWNRKPYDEASIVDWFKRNVDRKADWNAMVTKADDFGQGTAVVTPYPIRTRAPATIPVSFGRSKFPVRFAGAGVETPAGLFLAASVHLKAAGGLGKEEDGRRLTEAAVVNEVLRGMRAGLQPVATVVAGDFNMLGTPDVARLLTQGLDNDRSGLCFAEPTHLGDPSLVYTHGSGAPYKSRLDYLGWSESCTALRDAFVLDTSIMPAGSLRKAKLKAEDSAASDHLPIIVDLLPLAGG